MKRLIIFITTLLLTTITVSAQQISREVAAQKATAFANKANPQVKQLLTLAYKADKPATALAPKDDAYFYVFNKGFNQGFVIVSGDERTNDILGYCDHGTFDPNNMPPNFKYFLEEYANQIQYMQEHNIQPAKVIAKAAKKNLGYFIQTRWDQGSPYNYYLSGYPTGCVATALAQVMFYWQWPEGPTSTIPAYDIDENKLSGNSLEPATFEWKKMKLKYHSSDYGDDHAVARLMQYVGHGVKMKYDSDGSGAWEDDIINAMTKYFGYPNDEQLIYRNAGYNHTGNYHAGVTATEWADTIYANLADSIPVIMCGQNSEGGHCFICDGYQDGKYHINWGWGSEINNYDGYFDLEVLQPEGTGSGASGTDGFTSYRSIVTRIHNPSKIIPPIQQDSIPLTASSIRLFAGPQTLTRNTRADNARGDLRYYIPVATNITDAEQVDTLIIGLGCYDEDDNMVSVYNGSRRTFTSKGGYYYGNLSGFAAEFPYGTYKFCPVWGDLISGQWRKINGSSNFYIQADVAKDGKSVTMTPSKAVSAVITESKSNNGYVQTLEITNIGIEPYTGEILVFSEWGEGDNDYNGGYINVEDLPVGASKQYTVTSYLRGSSYSMNSYTVLVVQNRSGNEMLWTNIENNTYISDFWTEAAWTGTLHLGNNLKFYVELENDGSSSSTQNVKVTLFPKGGKVSSGTSKTKSVTIGANTVASEEFDFPNLIYGKEYDIEINCSVENNTISCDTISTIYADYGVENYVKPVKGAVVWGNEASFLMLDDSVATWKEIPEDAYFVDATYSDKVTSLVPGANPNTLYLLAEGASVPTKLEGKNVIVGNTCEELNLEEGYDFYTTVDFTAQKANYRRTFVNGNDGTIGNWETLVLPFDVTKVTKDDGATKLSWFTDKLQHGKNFWIYKFTAENTDNTVVFNCPESATTLAGETPYIITVPAQSTKWADKWVLTGKELTFTGENVSIKASSGRSVTTLGADKKFDFIGRTYASTLNQIYYLNEAGNRFENTHNAWAEINPFRCYFVGYFNNEEAMMQIQLGDNETTPTGIEETLVDDAPTAVAPTVYTLDGKAVGTDVKQLPVGTYVTKGKKFMVNKFTPTFPRLK